MNADGRRQGGTLRVGIVGDGDAETINAHDTKNASDIARVINLFEGLYTVDRDLQTQPVLVERAERSADAATWTFHLRRDVRFHDGSTFTAKDLMWTIGLWSDPANAAVFQTLGRLIDVERVATAGDHTVHVPLHAPQARLPELLNFPMMSVFRDGDLPAEATIGTGPFVFDEFVPGQRSVFRRNPSYWRNGPHVDVLEIVSSYTDEAGRIDDLVTGAIDVAPVLDYPDAERLLKTGDAQVLRRQGNSFMNIVMRVDYPPFDDPRVRQALRLLVDRQELVDVVLRGLGVPASDVPGAFFPFFDDTLVREQDLDRARQLLSEAGHEDLKVTLQTSSNTAGFVETAEVFKRQAALVGVDVTVESVPAHQYFDPSTHYLKMPFSLSLWYLLSSLPMTWNTAFGRASQVNETHWQSERTVELLAQADAELDDDRARAIWSELQRQQFDEGGWIVWGLPENLDGLSHRVRGLQPSAASYCDNFEFRHAWLSE